MRIAHITDIHGDTEYLARALEFLKDRAIDVVACTGDLVGSPFRYEDAQVMDQAYDFVMRNVQLGRPIEPSKLFKIIRDDPQAPDALRKAAEVYVHAEGIYDAHVDRQCREVSSLFESFPVPLALVLGNWDPMQVDNHDHLRLNSVHDRSFKIKGVVFGGYNGAPGQPVFMPSTRFDGFSEVGLFTALQKNDPDVALFHTPPYGILDLNDGGDKHIGKFGARSYLFECSPALALFGHAHHNVGALRVGDGDTATVAVNSGNLGRYPGAVRSGTFGEIDLGEHNYVTSARHWQLQDGSVVPFGKGLEIADIS